MWLYIILCILLTLILIVSFFKIRYRFWSKQPVFHYYNVWYWIHPPGIINDRIPEANEYVNIINVKTREATLLSETDTQKVVNFVAQHYLRTKSASYLPEKKHIMTYFHSSKHTSYISVYNQRMLLYENRKFITEQKHMVDDEYLGMISETFACHT